MGQMETANICKLTSWYEYTVSYFSRMTNATMLDFSPFNHFLFADRFGFVVIVFVSDINTSGRVKTCENKKNNDDMKALILIRGKRFTTRK